MDIQFFCKYREQYIDLASKLRMLGDISVEYPTIIIFNVKSFIFSNFGYTLRKGENSITIFPNEYESVDFYDSIMHYF